MNIKPVRNLAAAAVVVLLSGGCETNIRTHIQIHDKDTSTISINVEFEGDIAEVLAEDPVSETLLFNAFTSHGVAHTETVTEPGRRSYRTETSYGTLIAASGITGLAQATLNTRPGTNTATVAGVLISPHQLIDAIREQTAAMDDGQAIAETMLHQTKTTVTVEFPGKITHIDGPAGYQIRGNQATFTIRLDNAGTGTGQFTVTGSTAGPPRQFPTGTLAAIAVTAAAGVVAWKHRPGHNTNHGIKTGRWHWTT